MGIATGNTAAACVMPTPERKQLEELGYIKVSRPREGNRMGKNVYEIVGNPEPMSRQNVCLQNEGIQNEGTNNNRFINTPISSKEEMSPQRGDTASREKAQGVLVPFEAKKPKPKSSVKLTFGEYGNVKLSDAELDRLTAEFGHEKTQQAIAFLDCYIEESGRKYKNHSLTLRRWVFNAVDEQAERSKKGAPNGRIGMLADGERDFAFDAQNRPF